MLDELYSYVKVVEMKSFTKAAESLGFTQPSISAQIKRLESYFNTGLLDRSRGNKRLSTTKNGKIVYETCQQMIALVEETKSQINQNNSSEEDSYPLKIGASFTIGNYFMPTLISKFLQQSDDKIRWQLYIDSGEAIANQVVNGELDIGLIAGRLKNDYDLRRIYFYSDELLLVANASMNYDKIYSQQDLQNQTWIFREETSDTYSFQKAYLESCHIIAKETMVFNRYYAIKTALKNNIGISLLPELVVADDLANGSLISLPMARRVSRSYSYLLRYDKKIDGPLGAFISLLDKYEEQSAPKQTSKEKIK